MQLYLKTVAGGGRQTFDISECLYWLDKWRAVAWYITDGSNPDMPIFYVSCEGARKYVETKVISKPYAIRQMKEEHGLNPDNAKIVMAYENPPRHELYEELELYLKKSSKH
jgi:hypothetical protein